jgi:gliding motility-associated-like protein
MKNRLLLLTILIFFIPFVSSATHIVGGSLTYEQLSGSTYRITLKLYRDCKPGSAAFPGTVGIEITKNDGTAFMTVSIPFPGANSVPPNIDTCAVNPGICLEEAVYTKIVTGLPPSPGGYHMHYQYCCRNSTLLNIFDPVNAGETWYAHIPDNGVVITNSSPKWVGPPPVFVCQGNNMSIDHSATDPDGDSLVYSLYTPYDGDTGPGPDDPTYPGSVFTVPTVTWVSTYGANNPLNASVPNSLTISPSGILNGVPPILGQFVAGVKCEEWRDGVKIGEILRDFQFNVVNCPPVAVASFMSSGACNGLVITFTNTTTPSADNYFWDFGDGTTTSDTSSAVSPSYTYPALGVYTALMIINYGTPCADTTAQTVNLSFVDAEFGDDAPKCKSSPVNFYDSTIVDPGSTITSWDWDFGDGFTSTSQNPSHLYNGGGTFNVQLIVTTAAGCKDTVMHVVNIQGLPIANAGNDTLSCSNNPDINLGGTILNAGGGIWSGSGIFSPPGSSTTTTLNPTYSPTAAAISNGTDTLLLTTTSNALCPADIDTLIITFTPSPTIDAGSDISVCKDTVNVPVCATVTVASGAMWQTSGTGTFVNPASTCTQYIPSPADTASGSVMLYVTSTGNGTCFADMDTVLITFTGTPVATITSNDSACAGNPFDLSVNITTGSGVWTTTGTGTFTPNDTTLNGVYYPSAADAAAGNVTVYFTSTNNGGCRSTYDTIDVTIIPSPVATFSSVSACPTFPVAFTDASTSPGSVVAWNWNFGDGATSIIHHPTHIYNAGGPYTVQLIVTSNNGCVDTVTNVVDVYYKPNAGFEASGVCLSEGVQFTDTSNVSGSTITIWNWNFGDAATSPEQNPSHFYSAGSTYNVDLMVSSAQGCKDTAAQSISVLPGPFAGFTVDDPTANVDQVVNFTDQTTNGAVSWFWDFGDSTIDSISTLQNPSHIYIVGGYYDVCLYATDINGCIDTICHPEIISLPPDVPSAFSPNGDGENDIFYVYGGPFKTFEFRIYNNWGELIFISNKQSEGWDGKRKGIDQPIGVYVYTVSGVTEDGEEHHLSGDVTLLR